MSERGAERNWKRIGNFDANERAVIRQRHFGWEKASVAQLADIFETKPQTITAILSQVPLGEDEG